MSKDSQEKIRQLEEKITELDEQIARQSRQLAESEKFVTLGQLTAGIAHEINTPLGALRSNHDLFIRCMAKIREILFARDMPESVRNNADLLKLLDNIDRLNVVNKNAGERIVEIVNSVRKYARPDHAEPVQANVNELLDNTLPILQHEFKNRIEIHRDYSAISPIQCFPHQLNQVFVNILVNACQAIEGKGHIFIKTYEQNDHVVIEIRDTGKGIPEENMSQIFKMGFTTKGAGTGMGLGLALVKQIIEDHQGSIEVESTMGQGTTFRILLPREFANEIEKKEGKAV